MMAQYSDERPPPLVDQRAPMGMAGMIQPPAGAAHAGNEGFFGAFPGHNSNNAYVYNVSDDDDDDGPDAH